MTLQIAFALYPLCLAGVGLVWTLGARPQALAGWLIAVAAGGSIAVFAFLAGPWAFTSYYLRYALPGLFALAVLHSYRRMKRGGPGRKGHAGRPALSAAVLLLFTALNASAVASHGGSRISAALSFPLGPGAYYVLQGGDSVVTNPFHALSGSKPALDIVRLNPFGNRARGIAPRALEDYEIFGDMVHSPCDGTVAAVRDTVPDNAPGSINTEYTEGNYIVVRCAEVEVFMAHLRHGSISAAAGEALSSGRPLGQVGNSGNTLEPHLHIEARKDGARAWLVFDGRRLSLNSVVIRTDKDARPPNASDRP